jgi:ribosomal protein L7/L12
LPPEHYIQQYETSGADPNSVEVVGWRVGANKVAAVQALREYSSLGLADAKHAVDSVLHGSPVRIKTNDAKSALDLAHALESLNFTVGSPQRYA